MDRLAILVAAALAVLGACSTPENAAKNTSPPAAPPPPERTAAAADSSRQMADTTAKATPGRKTKAGRLHRVADENPVERAWHESPLGQAMMAAKDSLIPVFKTTEITVTVVQDSIQPIAQEGAVRTSTRPGDSRIRIGQNVSVKLIADGCLVDSLSSTEQLVVPSIKTEWRFRVTPQRHGDISITARVVDNFQANGPPYQVPVTDLTIHVTSRPIVEVWHVVGEHQAELLPLFGAGGGGAAVIGWLIARWSGRANAPRSEPRSRLRRRA
jgi:hypothetical protein